MKNLIVITNLEPWEFTDQNSVLRKGVSAMYFFEDFDFQRSTLSNDLLAIVHDVKLPAIFEADVKAKSSYSNGKAKLKYEVSALKLVKEIKVF